MNRLFLPPGAIHFATGGERIETVLGSCVSVSLRDPATSAAALSHCVLPAAPAGATGPELYRFCDAAVEAMLAWFAHRGVPSHRLQVKLFGGAEVLPGGARPFAGSSVGAMNTRHAAAALARHGLVPSARQTGGAKGRYLIFDTATGEVWIRQLTDGARA